MPPQPEGFIWGSGFASAKLTVNKASTSVVTVVSPNPVFALAPVNLQATVSFVNGIPPTGTVTFLDGAKPIGSAAISTTGTAALTATFTGGVHSITAAYSGDSNYTVSTSPALSLKL